MSTEEPARSLLRVPLSERDQRTDHRTLRALGRLWPVALEPERARDVEMRPLGAVLDRRVEERGRFDRAALAPRAVADIRDLTLDLVAVLIGERHRPQAVAGVLRGLTHELDE